MINPAAASLSRIDDELWNWLNTFQVVGLRDRKWLEKIRASHLAAYAFGQGGHDRVRLATDFITWLFLFDDAYAENTMSTDSSGLRKHHLRYEALLQGDLSAGPSNQFGKSLTDILMRASQMAPKEWVLRLGNSIRDYFEGCEMETAFRASKMPLSLEAYLRIREKSVGVYQMIDCVECANDSYLTPQEARNPMVAGLRRAAVMVTALTNDIYSSSKEAKEEAAFNAVLVCQRIHGNTRQSAVDQILELQDRYRLEFLQYSEICLQNASPGLQNLIAGIPVWINGNHRWSSETPRYNQLDDSLDQYRPPPSAPSFPRPSSPRFKGTSAPPIRMESQSDSR